MSQLIWTILGIGLMAIAFAAGQNYIDPNSQVRRETRDKVTFAFHNMIAAYNNYTTTNGTPPSLADWQTQLVPAFTSQPVPITGLTWSYANNATYGDYFCLSGNVSNAQNNGIASITATAATNPFAANMLVIAYNACGKRSSDGLGTAPASWPGMIYITYWLAGV